MSVNEKIVSVVDALSHSEFMNRFDSLREEMEGHGAADKEAADTNNSDKRIRLKTAYNESARTFNNLLKDLKQDMLRPRKRKLISKDFDGYIESYAKKLEDAETSYQKGYAKLRNEDQRGIDLTVVDVGTVIKVITTVVEILKGLIGLSQEARAAAREYIETNFVEAHTIKLWDKL